MERIDTVSLNRGPRAVVEGPTAGQRLALALAVASIPLARIEEQVMRIKGGGARAMVEAPRRTRARRPPTPPNRYYEDTFDVFVPPAHRSKGKALAVVRDLASQGKARVAQDERDRDRAQLDELGQVMGTLTAELVVEVINHFVQRLPAQRTAGMRVLGELTSALFVEFWSVLKGDEALDRALSTAQDSLEQELGAGATELLEYFISFIEETEGQPGRRLMGTLYAFERES